MRRIVAAIAVAGLLVVPIGARGASVALGGDPGKVGHWSKPFAEIARFARRPPKNVKESLKSPVAVSMVVLPDGRIMYWGGLEGLENGTNPAAADGGRSLINSRARVLDIRNGKARWDKTRPETSSAHDLFCSDQRLLANGKLLVVGGTIWRADPVNAGPDAGGTTELFGSNAVRFFDPKTNRWRNNRDFMANYRWYPTLITQGDGKLFIAGGVARLIYNYSGQNVQATETFDPKTGRVKDNGADAQTSLPLFARLHLLPNGNIFYTGVGQMWGPFGQAVDEALWGLHKAYDPKKKTWTVYGMGSYGARSGAFSAMLPLEPPYKKARFLIGGGTLGSSPGSYMATDLSEIVTVKGDSVSSRATGAMTTPRWYSSAVVLPTGSVVALSGANRDEVVLPGSESPVKMAEIFNGTKWKPLSEAGRVRTYHNSAVLLADGSILVGGHAPINTGYGAKGDNSAQAATGTNNLKDPSFEIFKPPYLFRGPRPEIASVQRGLTWGTDFSIKTPQAGRIEKVVISRLPAVTHVTDADQRSIELRFSSTDGNTIRASVPGNRNVAPPGYYYLWLLTDNGSGLTPSNARIVKVSGRAIGGRATAPMGR